MVTRWHVESRKQDAPAPQDDIVPPIILGLGLACALVTVVTGRRFPPPWRADKAMPYSSARREAAASARMADRRSPKVPRGTRRPKGEVANASW